MKRALWFLGEAPLLQSRWVGGWVGGYMGGRVGGYMGESEWVGGWICIYTCMHVYYVRVEKGAMGFERCPPPLEQVGWFVGWWVYSWVGGWVNGRESE